MAGIPNLRGKKRRTLVKFQCTVAVAKGIITNVIAKYRQLSVCGLNYAQKHKKGEKRSC